MGSKVRPDQAGNYGTLGCFAFDNSRRLHLLTCDHVLKYAIVPEDGPWDIYFPFDDEYQEKIALFEGISLVTLNDRRADIAAARVMAEVADPSLLPEKLPDSRLDRFAGLADPNAGDEVFIWGARTGQYHPGIVLEKDKSYSWPHEKYGTIAYEYQFSVSVERGVAPEVGDSGGYVITRSAMIVGLLASISNIDGGPGGSIAHCVPLGISLRDLNLHLALGL